MVQYSAADALYYIRHTLNVFEIEMYYNVHVDGFNMMRGI